MKLEFEKQYIPECLLKDFGFDDYLAKFNLDLPFLNYKILLPLSKDQACAQLDDLKKIEESFSSEEIKVLVNLTQELPNMDFSLASYDNSQIDLVAFFDLFHFLNNHLEIEKIEKNVMGANTVGFEKIRNMIFPFLDKTKEQLRCSSEEKNMFQQIQSIETEIKNQTIKMEDLIFYETGLKMFYPFPKELSEDWMLKIQDSTILKVEKTKTGILVDYILSAEMLYLQTEKDRLATQLNFATEEKLLAINQVLKPYFAEFKEKYEFRRKLSFYYALIFAKNVYNLSWPCYVEDSFSCVEGRHPLLESYKKDSYNPLTLQFLPGTTAIIGSNMSGKTSVMRNLYFLTTLCKFGLPLPVKEIRLPYPADTFYMIRSSGRPELNLSSFTEELSFFENKLSDHAYVFVDELFQSTNSSSGLELSKIFLECFSRTKVFFVCSTHYLNLLSINNVQFFKMSAGFKPIPIDSKTKNYNLEDEMKKPLELCLKFNLPFNIKTHIQTCLEKYKN